MQQDISITFHSATRAQVGAAVLEQHHIPYQLHRISGPLAARGCGYALRVRSEAAGRAVQALRQSGVSFQRVFREGGDGSFGELIP